MTIHASRPAISSRMAALLPLVLIACAPGPDTVSFEPDLDSPDALSEWTLDGTGEWEVRDGMLVLARAGTPFGPIRRPAALAILQMAPLERATVEVDLRCAAPIEVTQRDLQVIVGYESPTRFYYIHLSGRTDANHNGIFLVDDADRRRIDDGTSPPQLRDQEWHHVRVERDGVTGSIDVYVDGSDAPVLHAIDTTIPAGRIGFGSFDDTGEFRNIVVSGSGPSR